MNWVMLWGDLGDVVGCMEWFRVMVGRTLGDSGVVWGSILGHFGVILGWFLGGLGVFPGCIGVCWRVYGIVWTRFGGLGRLWGDGVGAEPRVDETMGKTKACLLGR